MVIFGALFTNGYTYYSGLIFDLIQNTPIARFFNLYLHIYILKLFVSFLK